MDFMRLDVVSWDERGVNSGLPTYIFQDDLFDVNSAIKSADQAVSGLWHMSGVDYVDQSEDITKVFEDVGRLYTYVGALPQDLVDRLDEPFYEGLMNGPVQALSKISMDDFTTANTCGVTAQSSVGSPSEGYVDFELDKDSLTFTDFIDGAALPGFDKIERISGDGFTLIGPDGQAMVPGFADIFKGDYDAWQADHPDEHLDFAKYMEQVFDAGQFDHEACHPVKSVVSDLVTMVPGVNLVFATIDAILGKDVITGEDMTVLQDVLNLVMSGVDVVALGLAGFTAGGSLFGAEALDEAAKAALRQSIKDAVIKELIATSVSGVVSGLSYDAAIDLGFSPKVATLISLGLGVAVNAAGTTYVVKNAAGKVIAEIPAQSTGITVSQVTRSGIPGLWDRLVHSPFDRGNLIDKLLNNNMGHNYPTIDIFDDATGEATSIKSLDTASQSYQTYGGLKNRLENYVDDLASFTQNTKSSKKIYPGMVKSRTLELALPDIKLSGVQKQALDDVKAYALSRGVSVKLVVVI
jgi:hypothetical protein